MTDRPPIGTYALAVLFRSVGRDLSRSLPPKEKPAKELPPTWKLALMRASLEIVASEADESLFAPALTISTKGSELSREIGDNGHRRQQTNVRSREESMDAALGPGRGIGRDIASGEKAERQIDAFISHRHNIAYVPLDVEEDIEISYQRDDLDGFRETVRGWMRQLRGDS
jgi:hypothetical protein